MKIWEAVLKSWDIELFSDIELISEQFVCYPLYHGKIKSYFGNFNRFISGIGRWKVLTSISCRFSLDISMNMSETCLKSWNSQLFNDICQVSEQFVWTALSVKEIRETRLTSPYKGAPRVKATRVNNCLKKQLVAGKGKCLKCSRISLDISMKIWEAVLKSWDIELFSDIGLISEQFVCYPLYHGKIKSYFGNFNRFISGIGRWKVLTSISCRFSLDISMKMSETCLKSGNSQLFNGI